MSVTNNSGREWQFSYACRDTNRTVTTPWADYPSPGMNIYQLRERALTLQAEVREVRTQEKPNVS